MTLGWREGPARTIPARQRDVKQCRAIRAAPYITVDARCLLQFPPVAEPFATPEYSDDAERRPHRMKRIAARLMIATAAIGIAACDAPDAERAARGVAGAEGILVVFNAGSLAHPLRVALDSFARREGITLAQESAGSLETARKITELQRIPDIVALADEEIFPRLLMPAHVGWYARFARNRLVLSRVFGCKDACVILPSRKREGDHLR